MFDEAHNIDDVCVEAMSVKMDRLRLEQSIGNLTKLKNEVDRVRKEDNQRLQDEYQRLVKGLHEAGKLDVIQAAQIGIPAGPPAQPTGSAAEMDADGPAAHRFLTTAIQLHYSSIGRSVFEGRFLCTVMIAAGF